MSFGLGSVAALLLLAAPAAAASTPPLAPNAWACGAADIPELCRLTKEDQEDRSKQPIDWANVTVRDRARRAAVIDLVRSRPLRTSGDHFHAALVMQHGETWEDHAAAHILSTRGLQLAPSDQNLQRMVAASWDRMMHRMGHKQWFGTNTFRNPDGITQPKEIRPDLLPDDLIELWSRPWIFPE
jgi:hypothetical protein